jgi:dGTPase
MGPDAPKCFEAQIMDWADDITYACHDVEDFFRIRVIPLDRLFDFRNPRGRTKDLEEPDELALFLDYIGEKWEQRRRPFNRDEARSVWRDLSTLITIAEPYQPIRAIKVNVHESTSALISSFLDNTGWEGEEPCRFGGKLMIDPRARLGCDLLKELIWCYVIDRPALATQQYGHATIVQELVRTYYEGEPRLLPADRLEELEDHGDKLRVAADHVSSLTEANALALYRRMIGTHSGYFTDYVWMS